MGTRKTLTMVMVTVMALTIAACGGEAVTTTGGGGAASTELTTSVKEYVFTPNTWTVPAGEQVTITITNEGSLVHEWVLLQEGVTIASEEDLPDSEEELEENFVNVEKEVEPGETTTLTFEAPPAGTYQVICAIPGHFNAGLKGTLTSEG